MPQQRRVPKRRPLISVRLAHARVVGARLAWAPRQGKAMPFNTLDTLNVGLLKILQWKIKDRGQRDREDIKVYQLFEID